MLPAARAALAASAIALFADLVPFRIMGTCLTDLAPDSGYDHHFDG